MKISQVEQHADLEAAACMQHSQGDTLRQDIDYINIAPGQLYLVLQEIQILSQS